MNPIGTMIELLVIGIQAVTGMYLVASALVAFGVISPLPVSGDNLPDSLIFIVVSAWAYTLAIMMDRLADDWQDRMAEKNNPQDEDKKKPRVKWYGHIDNAPQEDKNFRQQWYAVANLRLPEIDRTIAYYRSRVRISRATRLTVPLTVFGAVVWMLSRYPDQDCAAVTMNVVVVTIAGIGVTILSHRTASLMYVKYNGLVRGIYRYYQQLGIIKTLDPAAKDQTHQ